ncbi:MAG: hypothetical protein KDB57_07680 [Solirubrobacterales bacterium]|nr:hypothetical protein [Solirubrobacterales bacterium]
MPRPRLFINNVPVLDRLIALGYGRVDDGIDPKKMTRGENGVFVMIEEDEPVGFVCLDFSSLDLAEPSNEDLWEGPTFDVPVLGVEEVTIGEVALAVRSTFGDEPTLNRIYFERAAGLEGQAAIDCWRLCLQCGDSMAHFGLGTTLLEAGQAREAYQHLRHYVRIAPLVAWNWRWYGKAAEEIGETGEARRAYGRAIEIESKYCQEETDAANLLAALEGSRRQKDGQTDDPGEESNRKDNP